MTTTRRAKTILLIPALLSLTVLASPAFAAKEKGAGKEAPRKPVTVTSDTMEALANENIVVFKGNVVAVEDFTLCSDELEIRYSDNKDVKEIEASGNVRIFQNDKASTSDKAVYNRVDRTIVLTGRPQVKQCTDLIKGDKITVFIDQDNALVEGEKGGRVKAVIMPEKNCPEAPKAQEKGNSEEARCKGPR
ncbi:MAG: lipopolysaccharide transport periplasmic protein LptA [Deltaproteobacteria bacterium]|nr:lipopolysaccharide transport periplasmic protein LptA [Deltaproteobacteria bacterium]